MSIFNQIGVHEDLSKGNVSLKENLLKEDSTKEENCLQKFFYKLFPITKYLSEYSSEKLKYDIIAGVTVGIMAIPQSLSYALLVNLPPQYGLYCCLTPLLMYGLLGSCGQVTIGPCAIISMMCGSAVSFLDPANFDEYIGAVMTVSFVGGLFLLLLGLLRLGFITSIMSETLITAFTAGSAFNIGASQLKHFWGVKTEKDSFLFILLDLFQSEKIAKFNWYAFIIGISACILLFLFKEGNKRFMPKQPLPVELFLIILYILLVWGFDLHNRWNLKYMGDYVLVKGFPPVTFPSFDYLGQLIPQGILISTIAFVITISAGKTFSRKNGYVIDENQELIALGGGSIAGAFLSAYSPSASLSRCSLIDNIGSKSPVNTLVSGAIILICLFLLMDVIKFIPNACLAAIVLVNLIPLFKRLGDMKVLSKTSKHDFWTFLITVITTATLGTKGGLVCGITTSFICAYLGWKTSKENPIEFIPLESKDTVISCKPFIYFFNRKQLQSQVEQMVNSKGVCTLDMRSLMYIDVSAMITLEEMEKQFNDKLTIVVSNDYLRAKLDSYGMQIVKTSDCREMMM